MNDFVEPTKGHGGLRGKPAPDVGIGIRVRGKNKKLTGYVSFKTEVLARVFTQEQLEDGAYCKFLVGVGVNNQHVLRILPAHPKGSVAGELPKANARLRKQTGNSWLLETSMIPLPPDSKPTRRRETKYIVSDGEHITVFFFPAFATEGLPQAASVQKNEKSAAPSEVKEPLPWEGDPDEL